MGEECECDGSLIGEETRFFFGLGERECCCCCKGNF